MATPGLTGGLVAVGAVIVVALLLRAMSGKPPEEGSVPPMPVPEPEPAPTGARGSRGSQDSHDDEPIDEDGDGVDDRLVVAVSSDGRAFVPDHHVVRVMPRTEEGEEWKVGARIKGRDPLDPASAWHPGDMRGVRVVRGDFDDGPWLLEGLGRDGDYLAFTFETRDAADAAKELFERVGVVKLGEDEDGRPMPPSAEQFEEARRIMSETAAELELPDDPDDGTDPGDESRREGTP